MTVESPQDIIESLARTPGTVSRIVEGLSEQHLSLRNSAEEFSALENICHLRDIEIEGYTERITRILHETQPSLPDINGSRLAIERDYNNQNAKRALEEFSLARRRSVEILRGLSADQFARAGTLDGVGIISLEKLLDMMLEHDEDHIDELQVIRRRVDRAPLEHD